jgi:tol-pal system protein YbgF
MRYLLISLSALMLAAPAFAQDGPDLIAPPPEMARPVMNGPGPGGGLGPSGTELQVRINALETQLRNMNGLLERTQYQNAQLQQALQRMNADVDGRFRMLEQRVGGAEAKLAAPPPAAVAPATPPPAAALTTPTISVTNPSGETDSDAHEAEKPAAPAAAGKGDGVLGTLSTSGKPVEAQALYDQAFQAMRKAQYAQAEVQFLQFIKENPKHRLSENAKYWLGETYYVRGKFQESAVTFAEGFQQFPKGKKAPDNLLKLSMALASLNKKPDACTTLAELKKRFPDASATIKNRAEQERKTLTCT